MPTNPFESKIKTACKVTANPIVGVPTVYISKSNTIRLNKAALERLNIGEYTRPGSKKRLNVNLYINKLEKTLIVEFTTDGIYAYHKNSGCAYSGVKKFLASYGMAPMATGAYEVTSIYADLEKDKYYVEVPLYGKRTEAEQNAE